MLKSFHPHLISGQIDWSKAAMLIELSYILYHTHGSPLLKLKELLLLSQLNILRIIFGIHKLDPG